jgi:hypothetical protein
VLPRLYLKLILSIVLIFLSLSLIARAIGMTQPPNPALRGFMEGCEGKSQPCWYGIVLGVTTWEEGGILLEKYNYARRDYPQDSWSFYLVDNPRCTVHFMSEISQAPIITLLELTFCGNTSLGDIAYYASLPREIRFHDYDFTILGVSNWGLETEKFGLFDPISSLSLNVKSYNLWGDNWQGFAFSWVYERQGSY